MVPRLMKHGLPFLKAPSQENQLALRKWEVFLVSPRHRFASARRSLASRGVIMNSDDPSLSSMSEEEVKSGGQEPARSRSKERKHKHRKKHKRHSHKHKHRHKSSSRKERKHKKHRSKHRHKDSDSESSASEDGSDIQLVDELLESGLEAVNNPGTQARERGRDVEILRAPAGNGIVESMKIVVNNHNGSKEEPVTVSSSEEEVVEASEDNSREASRKAEEYNLDSSDFLHIDEDLNLEELMKQKAALQACLGAYMSDVEEEEEPKQAPAVVEKPECDVVTIEDSDDGQSKKKEKRREKESRPKKRKRSSGPIFPECFGAAVGPWVDSLLWLRAPG
ncbi:putative serine/threonine-protein kinase PRP4-like [Penaeus vannamei]|uniref:Putative serine/threonine-protein kinase PRP4-like n=1 Tax=Penaeus vannamei TaxID=6689 RepID=A0A3R7NUF9_PENVA|nr:putative serine/threonine-protein kinase PRP4-like [Penaeus vannamei]